MHLGRFFSIMEIISFDPNLFPHICYNQKAQSGIEPCMQLQEMEVFDSEEVSEEYYGFVTR